MTLLELCEPLFLYVCRLSRSARKNVPLDAGRVRSEIERLFEDMRSAARAEPGLEPLLRQVELPLIFFVDFMIKESDLAFAGTWEEMAKERGELAGDEKFFDLLEQALEDRSTSSQVLAVYYTCIGLGFSGWYAGQPEYLRSKMQQLAGRIREWADMDETARICPEAYEHVDTSDLIEPPAPKLTGIAIVLVGAVGVLIAANYFLYRGVSRRLSAELDGIVRAVDRGPEAAGAGPAAPGEH